MKNDAAKLKVLKKLAPDQAGAKKLAQKYGDALVCVRHRPTRVAACATRPSNCSSNVCRSSRTDHVVGVKIDYDERALQAAVRAAGARWDSQSKLWRMPRRVAGVLRLHVGCCRFQGHRVELGAETEDAESLRIADKMLDSSAD